MKQKRKDIIIYVMNLPVGAIASIRAHQKTTGQKYKVLLIRDSRVPSKRDWNLVEDLDIFVSCDFSKPHKIAEALLPYQDRLLAITCRAEEHLSRFAAVIPHVPYLRTPSTESLKWASDKYEMRKRMRIYNPKITPKFTRVKDTTKAERSRVIEKIGFPMIIKPTNLAVGLLITVCYHEADLEKNLGHIFKKLNKAYKNDNRLETPKVIAEQFMDGDMYSIDSYVSHRGVVTHCPLVKVITGKKNGQDNLNNYLQITPTGLKSETVSRAESVAEDAIHALGLRSTTTHTELMKLDDEWKVIEIGARVGGFRDLLHRLTYGIDHSLNDILIRIPQKPVVTKRRSGFACAMKWYAPKEGIITEMKGIKKIEQLKSFHSIVINKKVGDKAVFARNGGRSIFNLFLCNSERSKLLADIRRVEQLIDIKVGKK